MCLFALLTQTLCLLTRHSVTHTHTHTHTHSTDTDTLSVTMYRKYMTFLKEKKNNTTLCMNHIICVSSLYGGGHTHFRFSLYSHTHSFCNVTNEVHHMFETQQRCSRTTSHVCLRSTGGDTHTSSPRSIPTDTRQRCTRTTSHVCLRATDTHSLSATMYMK